MNNIKYNINNTNKIVDDHLSSINQFYNLLYFSVRKRLSNTDKPVTILFSGGINSVILTCIAIDILDKKKMHQLELINFVYGNNGSYDLDFSQSFHKLIVVKYPWVKIKPVNFISSAITENNIRNVIYATETCDPEIIRSAIPMFLLAKYIKEKTNYVIAKFLMLLNN